MIRESDNKVPRTQLNSRDIKSQESDGNHVFVIRVMLLESLN
jgi:hypothetical protein